MDRYSEVKHLITVAQENGIVDFADYCDGISADIIEQVESQLGFKLPAGYKWWLKNYAGGEIYGEEIFSIYDDVPAGSIAAGDILYNYEKSKDDPLFGPDKLLLTRGESVFYFDLTPSDIEGNEYPVYYWPDALFYAESFLDFLVRRIKEDEG